MKKLDLKQQARPFNIGFTAIKNAVIKARIESHEREKRLTRLINSS